MVRYACSGELNSVPILVNKDMLVICLIEGINVNYMCVVLETTRLWRFICGV